MKPETIVIGSIFGGESPSQNYFQEGQYLQGVGIDPELPLTDAVGDRRSAGAIRPTAYSEFSTSAIDANPYWLLTTPKNALLYAYMNNGKVYSYDTSFASETSVGTPTSGAGNGSAYYNNYLYFATPTNIARYGPLNNSPALTQTVWTGATLGTQVALTNTTYPAIRGSGLLPNHPMHVHSNNRLYFGDFINGQGIIHAIKTTKVTDEGDTDDGSAYNVLDLPFGYMPTDIESYGTDLVISAIQTTNATFNQGKAALFFWDTISDSFYNQVPLPDSLVTALLNNNGALLVFSGPMSTGTDVSNGYRVSQYLGGQSIQTLYYSEIGTPPLAGAVDAIGDRVLWGTFTHLQTTTAASPEYFAVVMSIGAKNPAVGGGVHCIAKASAAATAADGFVTAVKNVQQSSLSFPKVVMGWRDSGGYGLDKQTTTYTTSIFRTRNFVMGRPGIVKEIRFNVSPAIAANMTITPKLFLDDFTSSSTEGLTVVNATNYASSEKTIKYRPDTNFDNNFVLELRFSGTALVDVKLPITFVVELKED
jgi:hypothetical protein